MAICASGEKLLQEATGRRRGRVYPVAKKLKIRKRVEERRWMLSLLTSNIFSRSVFITLKCCVLARSVTFMVVVVLLT